MASPLSVTDLELPWLDRNSAEWAHDPFAVLRDLRAHGWLAQSMLGYEVLSHEVTEQFMRDRRAIACVGELFSGLEPPHALQLFIDEGLLPALTGEKHERIRRVLMRAFSPSLVEGQRDMMRAVADRLIDGFIEERQCDVVDDFSHRYPIEVACRMLGVPVEDIDSFDHWTVDMAKFTDHPMGSGFDVANTALVHTSEYLDELLEDRRRNPRDDFISHLIAAQEVEGRLTPEELQQNLNNLLLAGHDTTRYQFAWIVYLLGTHPASWAKILRDRSLIPGAIDEGMRLQPVLRMTMRRLTEPATYRDVAFPAGSVLICNTYAANRDPEAFPEPERFDIERPNAGRHLTFSAGPHLCLGRGLARTEMAVALDRFADRIPDFRVESIDVGPAENMIGGPHHVHVTFSGSGG